MHNDIPPKNDSALDASEYESDEWADCASGEIAGMVKSLRINRRKKQLLQRVSVGTTLLVLFTVTIWSLPTSKECATQIEYACSDVIDQAEEYVAGQLSAIASGRLEEHLGRCPNCREHVGQIQAEYESNLEVPPVLQTGQFSNNLTSTTQLEFEPTLAVTLH